MGNLGEVLNTNPATGVTVLARWNDTNETFRAYISFGEYIAKDNTDSFGLNDDDIFFYAQGMEEIEELKTNSSNGWLIEEVWQVYYEDELRSCSRCESTVGAETLITLGDASICEICWDDL